MRDILPRNKASRWETYNAKDNPHTSRFGVAGGVGSAGGFRHYPASSRPQGRSGACAGDPGVSRFQRFVSRFQRFGLDRGAGLLFRILQPRIFRACRPLNAKFRVTKFRVECRSRPNGRLLFLTIKPALFGRRRVQRQVELQHVDARFADQSGQAALGLLRHQLTDAILRHVSRFGDTRHLKQRAIR
jgi:hypothetical protein